MFFIVKYTLCQRYSVGKSRLQIHTLASWTQLNKQLNYRAHNFAFLPSSKYLWALSTPLTCCCIPLLWMPPVVFSESGMSVPPDPTHIQVAYKNPCPPPSPTPHSQQAVRGALVWCYGNIVITEPYYHVTIGSIREASCHGLPPALLCIIRNRKTLCIQHKVKVQHKKSRYYSILYKCAKDIIDVFKIHIDIDWLS